MENSASKKTSKKGGKKTGKKVKVRAAKEAKLVIPVDPLKVFAINDKARRADVGPSEDLWTVDKVHTTHVEAYDYRVPTLAPHIWPSPRQLDQLGYTAEFTRRFPIAAQVLNLVNHEQENLPVHVWVAGGAAASPYFENAVNAGDVDFFVVGIDPKDEYYLWACVHRLFDALRAVAHDVENEECFEDYEIGDLVQKMDPGLITITMQLRTRSNKPITSRKYQIILRAYSNISAVIHAFDIPSCCIAFDGKTAVTTTLGAYAQRFRTNLVNPAYRSTTFETRLEKYFHRSYALGFVHLKPDVLVAHSTLDLPHMTLKPILVRGNRATGTIQTQGSVYDSDYETHAIGTFSQFYWDNYEIVEISAPLMNLSRLAAKIPGASIVRCSNTLVRHSGRRFMGGYNPEEWLPFEKWYDKAINENGNEVKVVSPPTYSDAFPRCYLNNMLRKFDGDPRITSLMKYYGMSAEEVKKLFEAYVNMQIKHPGRKISVNKALTPFKNRILERYEKWATLKIDWWITVDPERQYTASLNPRIEDPTNWYSSAYVELSPKVLDPTVFIESLIGAIESSHINPNSESGKVYGNHCGLCMSPVLVGSANSITLPCGHTFHWSACSVCPGLFRWTVNNTDCPNCRKDFNKEAEPSVQSPIVLEIDWS